MTERQRVRLPSHLLLAKSGESQGFGDGIAKGFASAQFCSKLQDISRVLRMMVRLDRHAGMSYIVLHEDE